MSDAYLRESRGSRDWWLTVVMALVVVGLVGYIGYSESVRASRRTPPSEYLPPVYPVSLNGAIAQGSATAGTVLLVYSDFMCPACGRFALQVLPELERRYVSTGMIRVALRHTPVGTRHALAGRAAEAAFCADEQGQPWERYKKIYAGQVTTDYGRAEAAIFDRDIKRFASELTLSEPDFSTCLGSDRAAERVYLDAGSSLALGVESTPSLMIGAAEGNQLRVARHFRGLPKSDVLFAAIEAALAQGVNKDITGPGVAR